MIPTVLAENTAHLVISPQVQEVIANTKIFLVENPRSARRYISSLKLGITIEELQLEVLDKDTPPEQVSRLMMPLLNGSVVALRCSAGSLGSASSQRHSSTKLSPKLTSVLDAYLLYGSYCLIITLFNYLISKSFLS